MLSGNSAGCYSRFQEVAGIQTGYRTAFRACKLSQSWSHAVIEAGNCPVHVTMSITKVFHEANMPVMKGRWNATHVKMIHLKNSVTTIFKVD